MTETSTVATRSRAVSRTWLTSLPFTSTLHSDRRGEERRRAAVLGHESLLEHGNPRQFRDLLQNGGDGTVGAHLPSRTRGLGDMMTVACTSTDRSQVLPVLVHHGHDRTVR